MSLRQVYKQNIVYILSFLTAETVFIIIVLLKFPQLFQKLLPAFLILAFLAIAYVPILNYFRIKYYLEKDYPFFIALLYSLSDISSSRKRFFEMAAEAKEFKYISKVMKKILDLSVKFRMGFAEATRHIQKTLPDTNFTKFLDRFSSALEVGENLTDYLEEEFKIALDNYETVYKKSLENIRTIQDMVVAFMSSLAFGLVIAILLPFLVGLNIMKVVYYFMIAFMLLNILVVVLSRYFIVEDSLHHNLKDKPEEYVHIYMLALVLLMISTFLLIYLQKTNFPLLIKFAIAVTPLSYASYRMILYERSIKSKEEQFPVFMTTLAGLIDVLGTSLVKVVGALRVHDFKKLNEHIEKLYKRLVVSYDYEKSWYYFAAEIGSMLVARSILIFSRAVELGGDAKKIGEKISDLFIRIIDLRKIKAQFLSNSRGMFYGGYIAFVAILYISIEILKMLQNLFQGITNLMGSEVFANIGLSIFNINVDMNMLRTIIDIMTISQAFFVALVLKNIDGGSKIGIFLDFAILLWIAGFLAFGMHYFFAKFFTFGLIK